MATFLRDLKASRHYTFLYVSLWKIACFFLTMLLGIHSQPETIDDVGKLFDMFDLSFSERNFNVTKVRTMFTDIRKNILCLKVQQ
jgi:prolipoprotein diacylglyceryltransferase